MAGNALQCDQATRRDALADDLDVHGIDFIEVEEDQQTLLVKFIEKHKSGNSLERLLVELVLEVVEADGAQVRPAEVPHLVPL